MKDNKPYYTSVPTDLMPYIVAALRAQADTLQERLDGFDLHTPSDIWADIYEQYRACCNVLAALTFA